MVIDDCGLENFSLGLVAKHMGVKAPSLYYHFKDKAEILAEVARLILLSSDYQNDPELNWEERTIELCIETRRSLLKHPRAAPLILQFFPRHLLLEAYEEAVTDYPESRELHMAILEGIEKLTFGDALFEASSRARCMPSMPDFDPQLYPNLAQSVMAEPGPDDTITVESAMLMYRQRGHDATGETIPVRRIDVLRLTAEGPRLLRRDAYIAEVVLSTSNLGVFL